MAQVFQIADFRKGAAAARPPLPDSDIADQPCAPSSTAAPEYNGKRKGLGSERQARHNAWRAAEVVRRYTEAKLTLHRAVHALDRAGIHADDAERVRAALPVDDAECRFEHAWAIAAQLRAPAYDGLSLKWKRTQKLGWGALRDYISALEVANLIAADEEWLEANKPKRKPRAGKGGAE